MSKKLTGQINPFITSNMQNNLNKNYLSDAISITPLRDQKKSQNPFENESISNLPSQANLLEI